jgi:hypothetical protein
VNSRKYVTSSVDSVYRTMQRRPGTRPASGRRCLTTYPPRECGAAPLEGAINDLKMFTPIDFTPAISTTFIIMATAIHATALYLASVCSCHTLAIAFKVCHPPSLHHHCLFIIRYHCQLSARQWYGYQSSVINWRHLIINFYVRPHFKNLAADVRSRRSVMPVVR